VKLFGAATVALKPSDVQVDLHSHLLPGVDDGVADLTEAMACVAGLRDLGYRHAIVTPHIRAGMFDNGEAMLRETFDRFREAVEARHRDVRLELAAEYHYDETFADRFAAGTGQFLTFGDSPRRLLVELPTMLAPVDFDDFLAECGGRGIRPVIAHVERYDFVTERSGPGLIERWRSAGAEVQMNLGSLAGQYGGAMRRRARRLWRATTIDFVGSDLHGRRDLAAVRAAWKWLATHAAAFNPTRQRALAGHGDAGSRQPPVR
jgi:tyrosine-protein phosphatase YwqE